MATTAVHAVQQSVFPKSHVGFDSITNQIERKLLKRGFQFNVICVGTYASFRARFRTTHTPTTRARAAIYLQQHFR